MSTPTDLREIIEAYGGRFVDIGNVSVLLVPDCAGTLYIAIFGDATQLSLAHVRQLRKLWQGQHFDTQVWTIVNTTAGRRFAEWFGFVPNGTIRVGSINGLRMTFG